MGLFDFQCPEGHVTEWRGKYEDRPDVIPCETPGCKEHAEFVLSPVPTTFRAMDRRAFKRGGR
jgi:hypothetical protein